MLDRSVCYEAQLGSDEDLQSVMVDGKGTLRCHFGGDTGGQGGCVGCAESSLDECSDDRAAQFQVVDDGFAAVLADLCRGAGAEGS